MSVHRIGTSPAASPTAPKPAKTEHGKTFMEIVREGQPTRAAAQPPAAPGSASPGVKAPDAGQMVRKMLSGAIEQDRKMDNLLAAAARGKTFSAGELLALQASVFRYSQTVEVISRTADRLVGAVKQTLGTQV